MKWQPPLTIPNEVLFSQELTTLDKYILGVVHTFPEIKAEEIQYFIPDKTFMLISSNLTVLEENGYVEKDRFDTFKIKNLLNLNNKSQENRNIQDQEGTRTAKKRIIQRQKSSQSNDSVFVSVKKQTKETNSLSSPLGEDRVREAGVVEPEKKFIPLVVQSFIDVWFRLDLYIQGDATKGFSQDIEALKKLITGRFFSDKNVPFQYLDRAFTLEEWTLAVGRLHKMAYDPEYLPANKTYFQKMYIRNFLYNEYGGYEGDRLNSVFLRCLEEEPRTKRKKRKETIEEDQHPKITARLIHLFKEFRKEVHNQYGYKPDDTDTERFKFASKRIVEFFAGWRDQIINYPVEFSGKNALADFTWAAVLHDMESSNLDLTPGFFCSNWTFEKRLPKYLKHKRLIK